MSVTSVMAVGLGLVAVWWLGRAVVRLLRRAAVSSARERLAGLTEVVGAWQAVNRDEMAELDEQLSSMELSLDLTERLARVHGPRFARLERRLRSDTRWQPAPRLWLPPSYRRP